jgi:hypothetical protein
MSDADIVFFLTEPQVNMAEHRRTDGTVSTLYLLRQEAQRTLADSLVLEAVAQRVFQATEVIHPEPKFLEYLDLWNPHRRTFASAMVVFAGIDLLAKFAYRDARRWRVCSLRATSAC